MRQLTQELIQFLLPVRQLAPAAEIDAETRHDAVDDEQAVVICCEVCAERVEEFELVLAVQGAAVGDVFLSGVGVHWVYMSGTGFWGREG